MIYVHSELFFKINFYDVHADCHTRIIKSEFLNEVLGNSVMLLFMTKIL